MSGQESRHRSIDIGRAVYSQDGDLLGTVRGLDEHGFYVTAADGVAVLSGDATPGSTTDDVLMWRCWACGEMGQIEDIPESCPDCGAPKEDIYYWLED